MKNLYQTLLFAATLFAAFIQLPANAQHFQFQGGSFLGQQWINYLSGAALNGESLVAGDEVAVFDGDIMVGAFVLSQVCTPENQFENVLTSYSKLLDESIGFTQGNQVVFKCWQAATNVEAIIWEAEWTNPYGDAWTEPTFPAGANNYSLPVLDFSFAFNGELSGIVSSTPGALPLEGALVEVLGTDFSAISQTDGSYQIVDVPSGTYNLAASATGYLPDTVLNVNIVFDQATTVDFSLTLIMASVTGTVSSVDGTPIEGAGISVQGESFSTTTLADGSFVMQQIPEGIYSIKCTASDYFPKTNENVVLSNGGTTTVDFTLINSNAQSVPLKTGYSLVSSYIFPDDPDMLNVLDDVLDNLSFVRNDQGITLIKFGPNWMNGIGDWNSGDGYLVKMNSADTVILNGSPASLSQPIILKAGYSIIPYLLPEPKDAKEVFDDVLGNLKFVRNSTGLMLIRFGETWINGIGEMKPGEGYLVKMNNTDTLQQKPFECGDLLYDTRDGQTYKTVQIGEQCWMAENLNVGEKINGAVSMTNNDVVEKYCYDDLEDNCDVYGGLYQWNEMMQYTTTESVQGICPEGWHLPADAELCSLTTFLDASVNCLYGWSGDDVGGKLKEIGFSHWEYPNEGADNSSGFTTLPGGCKWTPDNSFQMIGLIGYIWSSTQDGFYAWRWCVTYDVSTIQKFNSHKAFGFSVRCIRNNTLPPNQAPSPPLPINPPNESSDQNININFSWSCSDPENDPLSYDVYFGTEPTPPQVATAIADTFYTPGTLEYATTYYWKIVAHDDQGNSTEGEVWSFATEFNSEYMPTEGLVGWWPFNGNANDESGNENHGQLNNVESAQSKVGDANGAFNYNGENSYIRFFQPFLGGNQTSEFSMFARVKPTQPGNIWGKSFSWGEVNFRIIEDSTVSIVWANANNGNTYSVIHSITPIEFNEWIDIILTFDNSTGSFYYNGVQVPITYYWVAQGGSVISTTEVNSLVNFAQDNNSNNIGYKITSGQQTDFYEGVIDEFAIWNRALSPEEVFDIYASSPEPSQVISNPIPENGASIISTDVNLSWSCSDPENDPLTYDVYFSTEATPPQVATAIADTFYTPETLEYATTYYWKIVAHDDQGNDTEGEVWSFTTIQQNNGFSLEFDGVNDFVDLHGVETFNFGTEDFTISHWFKSLTTELPENSVQTITKIPLDWSYGNYYYDVKAFHMGLTLYGITYTDEPCIIFHWNSEPHPGSFNGYTTLNTIDGEWHYITAVKSGTTLSVYHNGINISSQDRTPDMNQVADNDGSLKLGDYDNSIPHLIHSVEVWDVALNQNQIQSYMNSPPIGTENGLIGFWDFNIGVGSTITDLSGNGNHGTINGATWSTDVPNPWLNANFEANRISGVGPLEVIFTDLSTPQDSIISWQWDFNNDGTIDSEEQNPEWTYTDPGTYSVSLTVSDGENENTELKENYIDVQSDEELTFQWTKIKDDSELPDNVRFMPYAQDKVNGLIFSVDALAHVVYKYIIASNQFEVINATSWPSFDKCGDFLFDPVNERIIMWRSGTDNIYALPVNGGAWTQIGNGSYNSSMYGSGPFWNPFTEAPCVMNGYGWYKARNWIFELSNTTNNWVEKIPDSNNDPWRRGCHIFPNDDGTKLFMFSGQGKQSGNQSGPADPGFLPWATDVGYYNWFRDLWELDLASYEWTNILPYNSESIESEGGFAYYPSINTFLIMGGFIPPETFGGPSPSNNNLWKYNPSIDQGFILANQTGDIPPENAFPNPSFYDPLNDNIILFSLDEGIWVLEKQDNK